MGPFSELRPLRYWAFISYSRSDTAWAKRAQKWLEGLAIPQSVKHIATERGLNPRRIRPVFRDVDELAASSNLGTSIRTALDQSAYLIVICSPRSAQSKWVEAEIRHFIAQGAADRILLLLVDGEPRMAKLDDANADVSAAFSPALADLPVEPLWSDARPQADNPKRALTRVAAGMLGIGFDDLWRRTQRRWHKQLAITASLVAIVLIVVGSLYYIQSQPVDIMECRVGAVTFRDLWGGDTFLVEDVGVEHVYLCGDNFEASFNSVQNREDCQGPYGVTVLKGVYKHSPTIDSQTVYFVYNIIKGSPCCWWDAYDDADFEQFVESSHFRWIAKRDEPPMNDLLFSQIELEEHSSWSNSLGEYFNPLTPTTCQQSRLEAMVFRLTRWFAAE